MGGLGERTIYAPREIDALTTWTGALATCISRRPDNARKDRESSLQAL
jgi:hypothetical protein